MTEAQARELARALLLQITRRAPGKKAEAIKEALMDAYNDGWENGFEEGRAYR